MNNLPSYRRHFTRLVELKSSKTLGPACSAVARHNRELNECLDDASLFGAPSECFPLITRGHNDELDRIAKQHGFCTHEVLLAVVERRCRLNYNLYSTLCATV